MPKIKNIIIFLGIAAIFVAIYIFYIKGPSDDGVDALVSSSPSPVASLQSGATPDSAVAVGGDFLTLLLSVKEIHLNTAIFSDDAFESLHDSSITLVPDGTEGRVNPFAPLGSDVVIPPVTPSIIPPANTGVPLTP
ncbi:MAG: hypothetical protein V4699_00725 [Patescibacteria group bacterium]